MAEVSVKHIIIGRVLPRLTALKERMVPLRVTDEGCMSMRRSHLFLRPETF